MARIRSIHPEQWTDDKFVTCEPLARLLALGLRNEADDNGIFEWNPIKLKMRLLPADNCDVSELLSRLESTEQIFRFTDEQSGKSYGMIRNFQKYQKPKKPSFTRPVPSGPLPTGYQLSRAYAGVGAVRSVGASGTEDGPVRNQWGNPPADGEGRVKGKEEKDPAATRGPDKGLHRVLAEAGWTRTQVHSTKALALLQLWEKQGLTTHTLHQAIVVARQRCGGELPKSPTYLRGIVGDLLKDNGEGIHGDDNCRNTGSAHHGLGGKDYTEGAARRLEDLPWVVTGMQ